MGRTHKRTAWINEYWKDFLDQECGAPEKPIPINFDIPEYSTDISAAWAVVGKLIERGWLPEIEYEYKRGGYWKINLGHMELDAIDRVVAETLPCAVCLAALKAIES